MGGKERHSRLFHLSDVETVFAQSTFVFSLVLLFLGVNAQGTGQQLYFLGNESASDHLVELCISQLLVKVFADLVGQRLSRRQTGL